MRHSILVAASTATLALSLAGCHTSPSTADQSNSPATNPCFLLTSAQVGAALGVSVGAGVESGVNAPSCNWQSADGSATAVLNYPEDTSQVCTITPALQGDTAIKLVHVSGLGTAACYTELGTIQAMLDVSKGSKAFSIGAGLANGSQQQSEAAEKALALEVLAQI